MMRRSHAAGRSGIQRGTQPSCGGRSAAPPRYVSEMPRRRLPSLLFEDRLGVDGDPDVVAHYHTAEIERIVPAHAEIVAVDGGLGDESRADLRSLVDAALPPGSRPAPEIVDVEHRRAGDAADGQVPFDPEIQRAGSLGDASVEADLRMTFDVDEVGAAEVI